MDNETLALLLRAGLLEASRQTADGTITEYRLTSQGRQLAGERPGIAKAQSHAEWFETLNASNHLQG